MKIEPTYHWRDDECHAVFAFHVHDKPFRDETIEQTERRLLDELKLQIEKDIYESR